MQTVVVLIGITLTTFILLNVVPGDPVRLMLGDNVSEPTVARIRAEWGLDLPLHVRYINFLKGILRLDLGTSYFTRQDVFATLAKRFPVTASVGLLAYCVAVVVGLSAGVISALNRGRFFDRFVMGLVVFNISAPSFWIGMILQIIFGVMLRWVDISGLASWKGYILPCLTLGLRYAASNARFTRNAMLDVLGQDYVRTARAKGLKENTVILVHAFQNALIPIVTLMGMQLGGLLTGSMLVETVFNLPGIGSLTITSMQNRDLPLLQGCVIYIAVVFVLINLVVDLLYAVIDPRIRLAAERSD